MRFHSLITALSFTVLSLNAHADGTDQKKIHIHSTNPKVDVSKMGDQYSTHAFERAKSKSSLPNVKERDTAFVNAQLALEVKDMDHLDKDLLYLRAKKYPIEKLAATYPNIETAKLVALKKEVAKSKPKKK